MKYSLFLLLFIPLTSFAVTVSCTPGDPVVGAPVDGFIFTYGVIDAGVGSTVTPIEVIMPDCTAHTVSILDGTYEGKMNSFSGSVANKSDDSPTYGFTVLNDVATMFRPNPPSWTVN